MAGRGGRIFASQPKIPGSRQSRSKEGKLFAIMAKGTGPSRHTKPKENSMLSLYHASFEVIPDPDISRGKKNADFGQGFYLSDNQEFSKRWARYREGSTTYLNTYSLRLEGLKVKRLQRDLEWFGYIYNNRTGHKDALQEYDVIVGPIANDTIYDTLGITTSGFISKEQALELLLDGPIYEQTVIKTKEARSALQYVESIALEPYEINKYREAVRLEEERFLEQFGNKLKKVLGT